VLESLAADDRVHLLGEIRDVPELLSATDVVVLPTYREGFPYVPLEAAAMALPVVATRIPAASTPSWTARPERLVPPRDAVALARAVGDYLADPALRRRHGPIERGVGSWEEFQPSRMWQRLYEEYSAALAARGRCGEPMMLRTLISPRDSAGIPAAAVVLRLGTLVSVLAGRTFAKFCHQGLAGAPTLNVRSVHRWSGIGCLSLLKAKTDLFDGRAKRILHFARNEHERVSCAGCPTSSMSPPIWTRRWPMHSQWTSPGSNSRTKAFRRRFYCSTSFGTRS